MRLRKSTLKPVAMCASCQHLKGKNPYVFRETLSKLHPSRYRACCGASFVLFLVFLWLQWPCVFKLRYFTNLEYGSLQSMTDTIASLMDGLRMVWVTSRHYTTDERMQNLMERIALLVCQLVGRGSFTFFLSLQTGAVAVVCFMDDFTAGGSCQTRGAA